MSASVIYVTTKSKSEAREISKIVISERLAACSNILGPINSIYHWNDKICEDEETAFLLKTSKDRVRKLIKRIEQVHSNEVPCIIETELASAHRAFADWIFSNTRPSNI